LETRAVKGAMTNKLNSTITIFHLKNNYNWTDKVENLNVNYDKKDLTDEEKDKIDNLITNN
jgi:hypothetical protein